MKSKNTKSSYVGKFPLALAILSCTFSIVLSGCDSKPKLTPEQQAESNRLMKEVEKEIHLSEISKPMSKAEFPHLYDQWGDEWMEIINTMLPLAAERVQSQPECDIVKNIDLSPTSTKGKNPILNISCENSEYFYVALDDVTKNRRLLPASELFGKSPTEYVNACMAKIKPELIHPETIQYDSDKIKLTTNQANRMIEVWLPFSVKTGFSTKVEHLAKCSINSELQTTVEWLSVDSLK